MNLASTPRPDFAADESWAHRLRELLARSGYDDRVFPERLGGSGAIHLEPRAIPRLLELTGSGEAIDTLIRLFLLGVEVATEEARKALLPFPLQDWVSAGILVEEEDWVESTVLIVPFEGLLVACDSPAIGRKRPPRPDHVHGMGASTLNLLRVTDRSPRERGLDLGTGCGIQGLLMARHTGHVVCTDVNPRALSIATFNARLNGVKNVEFRAGSLFEPVAGERFDLIVANSPFAVSPGSTFLFRDGGRPGDGFVRELVRESPGHLRAGGLCQATAQWINPTGGSGQARVRAWLEDGGCDFWVLSHATQSPGVYAENWISETEKLDAQEYAVRWHEWMRNLAELGAESISTGMMFIRRRVAGQGWFSMDEDVTGYDENAGLDVSAGFRLRDFLLQFPTVESLSRQRLKLGGQVRLETTLAPSPEGLQPERAVLRSRSGILYSGLVDEHLIPLLSAIEPSKTLGSHVAGFAGLYGQDPEEMGRVLDPMLRGFIERGFLVPGSGPELHPE